MGRLFLCFYIISSSYVHICDWIEIYQQRLLTVAFFFNTFYHDTLESTS